MDPLWFLRPSKFSLASRLVAVVSVEECCLPCGVMSIFPSSKAKTNGAGVLKLLEILGLSSALHGLADQLDMGS